MLPRRPRTRAVLALILAAASWGIGVVISKRAVAEIPPLSLLPIQLGASLLALTLLMRVRGIPLRDRSAAPILGRLGLLNPGLAYALSLLGLVHITASLSVMLWALEPLLIVALAGLVLGERIGPSLVVLSLVAVVGMALVIGRPEGAGSLVGVALTVAGVACCAVYTVVARRWLGTADGTAPVVLSQQAHALGLALAFVVGLWALGGAVRPVALTAAGLASALGSGVLYYGVAYWLYLSALREVSASFAAASFYLIPVFGVAGGFLLLGERLDPTQLAGVALVLVAVFAILRGARRSPSITASGHPL
jgi:drug/metabolite transporter (DMT)-like permease